MVQSREHASNVSYVLNSKLGHISPQYYVLYDDGITIVTATTIQVQSKIGKVSINNNQVIKYSYIKWNRLHSTNSITNQVRSCIVYTV